MLRNFSFWLLLLLFCSCAFQGSNTKEIHLTNRLGEVCVKGSTKDGRRIGTWSSYNCDGKLTAEIEYSSQEETGYIARSYTNINEQPELIYELDIEGGIIVRANVEDPSGYLIGQYYEIDLLTWCECE